MSMADGWIGVDLDGTLAELHEWQGPSHIGKPIPAMVDRVRGWLAQGLDVRICTARVATGKGHSMAEALEARVAITTFCVEQFGTALPITAQKDYQMIELWDDRAVTVETNTGKVIGRSRVGLE